MKIAKIYLTDYKYCFGIMTGEFKEEIERRGSNRQNTIYYKVYDVIPVAEHYEHQRDIDKNLELKRANILGNPIVYRNGKLLENN